jgi:ribosomal protein L17
MNSGVCGGGGEQAMRSVQRSSHAKEKRERVKSSNTVAARMKQVVEKMIISQKDGTPHAQITVFLYKSEQSEIISSFLEEMRRENVSLFNNRSAFLELVAARYDDIQKKASE